MERRTIIDGTDVIIGNFDKEFHNNKYDLYFNTKTGFEVLTKDPFYTDLPTMLDIGIMGHCTNQCTFCYQGSTKQEHMKLEDFKFIIDQVKHHASQVALGGRGNPEDHPQFEEIIKYARENNVVPNYTTAGNNLDHRIAKLSKEYCGAVAVSMYDQHYTFKALNELLLNKVKTNIHWIYDRYSHFFIMDVLEGSDIWNEFDYEELNALILLLFKPKGNAENLKYWMPTIAQTKELSHAITNSNLPFKIGMDSCLINKTQPYMELGRLQTLSIDTCESARMSVYISPDMKMIPFSFMDPKYGEDMRLNSIEAIWNNASIFKQTRKMLQDNPYTCPALRRCDNEFTQKR